MAADIELLPGKRWNAKAALHHALNEVKLDTPIIILWLDEGGIVHNISSGTERRDALWMVETERQRVLNDD
jgi:hypothetical protein